MNRGLHVVAEEVVEKGERTRTKAFVTRADLTQNEGRVTQRTRPRGEKPTLKTHSGGASSRKRKVRKKNLPGERGGSTGESESSPSALVKEAEGGDR